MTTSKNMLKRHYCSNYFLSNRHRITVNVFGSGGTGSFVMTNLARLDFALRAIGNKGLFVRLFDDDTIEPHNVGRQMFYESDIGLNKAHVIVERINRTFGTDWIAHTVRAETKSHFKANIIMTCVDNVSTRKKIHQYMKTLKSIDSYDEPYATYFWMDFGNERQTGQVVMGTGRFGIPQPEGGTEVLKTVYDIFPVPLKEPEDKTTCSMLQSLQEQDLFINSILAQYGIQLLWKLFNDKIIYFNGHLVNLEKGKTAPILLE